MHLLAKQAPNFESLTISLSFPTAFQFPQMPKLKKLVLDYLGAQDDYLLPVTNVLDASPCLQEFTLKCDVLFNEDISITDYEGIFEIPKFGFSHKSLQVFEISPFCERTSDHMELLKLIMSNCIALQKVIIHTETNNDDGMNFNYNPPALKAACSEMRERTQQVVAAMLPHNINLIVF